MLEEKIRKLKHVINTFNLEQEVPGFGMTIDQMLVYIPQLTSRKKKLDYMRKKLPKERESSNYGRNSNIVEYRYSNYDIAQAEADYSNSLDNEMSWLVAGCHISATNI